MIFTNDNYKIVRIGINGIKQEVAEYALLLDPLSMQELQKNCDEVLRWLDDVQKTLYTDN